MSKDIERDLGLFAVIAISMGAMTGSGIFILPGIAMAEAGPAVILAFVIASMLDARLRFVYATPEDGPAEVLEAIEDYHADLDDLCTVPVEQRSDRIAATMEVPVVLVHSKETHRGSFLRPIVERVLFE